MPFNVKPAADCADCPYGYCLEYVGDQEFKDRNTAFRLNQTPGWRCAFDNFVPGSERDPFDEEDYSVYVEQVIENAEKAGEYLFEDDADHWTDIDPDEFFLTAGQKGKVRGDTYEILVRAELWNCCAAWNTYNRDDEWVEDDREEPDVDLDEPLGVITLGDNYDIERLFTPEYKAVFDEIIDQLEKQGLQLSLSTPDAIVIRLNNLPDDEQDVFHQHIEQIDTETLDWLEWSRERVEGHLRPQDIIAAIGIKTSIRSDRKYQFIFEANAWMSIFRSLFGADNQRYYTFVTESYGASEDKVNKAVWLPSIRFEDDSVHAEPAVENVLMMESPDQTEDWFFNSLLDIASEAGSVNVDEDFLDALDITLQSHIGEFQ